MAHASLSPGARIGVRELSTLLGAWREDAAAGAPSYRALAARLRSLVLDGRVPVHTMLPSERSLAEVTGAGRTTTTAAYRVLREEGFAENRPGAGTWTTLPGRQDVAPLPVSPGGEVSDAGDLSSATPAAPEELFPAYTRALADLPHHLPGAGYRSAGLPDLRARIAARYAARGLPTDVEQVLVTAGAAQGLRLVLDALVARGDHVLVEHPTWPPALEAVRAAGGRPVALPVEDGWAHAAPRLLTQARPRLAYLMPDGQNPTGKILDGHARTALATALADARCVGVVDETLVDLDLRADLAPPDNLAQPDNLAPPVDPAARLPPGEAFGAGLPPGCLVHVGSASKSFWGGLRVGWVRADRALIRRLVVARTASDLGGPVLEQLATAHLLDSAESVLARRRAEFAARCRRAQALLAEHLPGWSAPTPDAGLVLWCTLPLPRGTAVAEAALRHGVLVPPGPRFGVGGGFESRLRICFGRAGSDLDRAVPRLAQAWHEVTGAPGRDAGRTPA